MPGSQRYSYSNQTAGSVLSGNVTSLKKGPKDNGINCSPNELAFHHLITKMTTYDKLKCREL